MNLRKHIAGFAVFLIILSSAIFINEYLRTPSRKARYVQVVAPIPQGTTGRQQSVSFDVRQVSLDFIKGESHTTLTLNREAGQFAPERLWVTTIFFSPNYPERGSWTSKTEIRRPFASGDRIEITATGECEWCVPFDTPKTGYFARVYVSTEDEDNSYPHDGQFSRDITTAVPVVLHWPDEMRRSVITSGNTPADKLNFSDR
ncbi:MAG: hypothetical protein H0U54_08050 [Acidobacteria bacterium]|nr:hypothetical protein [Acidobacteriota bacterium]